MSSKVGIHSEIGRLRKVIVHPPGPELLAVTPSTREEFLYDDIIDLDGAAEEHRRFTSILKQYGEVLEVRTLLLETVDIPAARQFLISRSEEATGDKTLGASLAELPADVLVERYIEGWRMPAGPFSRKLEIDSYLLPPLPNLFFMRDAAMAVGDGAVISAMRFSSRWAEEVLMRTILGFHPEFEGTPILYDGSDERRKDFSLEGGDVHPLSPDVLLVGISARTTAASLDSLCETLFEKTDFTDVIGVILPENRTAIHLDMVWTQLDRELAMVYRPFFFGPTRSGILHRKKGREVITEPANLFDALKEVGLPMEPVCCGDDSRIAREREQWASGCNFLAVAPGHVVSYARNEHTLAALEKAGFRNVDAQAWLLGDTTLNDTERVVITFSGGELVRGGGGPRCMSCPVLRDPL